MKKIISIILLSVLIFSILSVNAGAKTVEMADASETDGIVAALNAVEPVKEQMGISEIDFYELTYSDSVSAYDYTKDGLIFNCEFIPIKHGNALVGWVIKKTTDGDTYYQFTTAFTEEVNRIAENDTEFAIIYGYDASYLYDGKDICTLRSVSIPVDERAILESAAQLEGESITLKSIASSYKLQYSNPSMNSRAPVYFSCNVKYVSQKPYENLCWAACAASIVNFLKNKNYTAVQVAQRWHGEDDYNKIIHSGLQDDLLLRFGVREYLYKAKVPSSGVLLNNIQQGYPVQATFSYRKYTSIYYHETVIYGMNIASGITYIMDPEYGFCSASYSSSNKLTYVKSDSGLTLTLCEATCHYWVS